MPERRLRAFPPQDSSHLLPCRGAPAFDRHRPASHASSALLCTEPTLVVTRELHAADRMRMTPHGRAIAARRCYFIAARSSADNGRTLWLFNFPSTVPKLVAISIFTGIGRSSPSRLANQSLGGFFS